LSFDVCLKTNLVIPSQNECFVYARVDNCVCEKEGVFYPFKLKLAKLGIIGAQSVSYCVNGFVPIKLCNIGDKETTLYKNTTIGEFEINFGKDGKEGYIRMLNETNDGSCIDILLDKVDKNEILNEDQKSTAKNLLKMYSSVFSKNKNDIGFCDLVKHEIDLKTNSPVQQVVGKVPLHVEEWVDRQVENLKDLGILRDSVSAWSAPVVVVKKKNGDFRMCIDYRRLNSITIKPMYRIPDCQSLFNHLSGSEIFSTIDVSNAYYQCELREDDKKLTAFSTRKGHFEFNRMPFGLSGAPFTFQRLMHTILREENWMLCLVYLDDVLIFSKNFEEHISRTEIILEKIKQSGIKLSPSKCNFFLEEVSYLGHTLSKRGLHTDPKKISALKEWPLPSTVTEMRRFLGFINYYRKFVKSFAHQTTILESVLTNSSKNCTKKNDHTVLTWDENSKKAFTTLKMALCSAPCLSFPMRNCTYILDTDASYSAIGCVLSQVQNGCEKVIAYGSRKLSKTETNYCITRKELLSVYYFVTHFKQFLLGSKFIIRTDHRALKWLLNWDAPNTSQYCSWVAELEIYDFSIEHRAGERHTNADFLSRPFEQCQQCELNHENPKPKRNVKICHITEEGSVFNQAKNVHCKLGHIGEKKLFSVLKGTGNNTGLQEIVKNVINNCKFCAQRKVAHYANEEKHFTASKPFQTIALDIAGPLPTTKMGNRFLLCIVDIFSRYVSLFPIKNIDAQTILNIMQNDWIPSFGLPDIIITDGGSNFTGNVSANFFCCNNIKHHVTSPYHPQSNGLVERFFFTIKDMIFASCAESGLEWDKVLNKVVLGLRSTQHSATGYSPFQIVFGFTPKLYPTYKCNEQAKARREIQKEIQDKNDKIAKKNSLVQHKFKRGEKVMIRVPEKKPGIYSPRYIGPGTVEIKRENKSYVIKIGDQYFIRHEKHIKLFKGKDTNTSCSMTSIVSKPSPVQGNLDTTEQRYPQRMRQQVKRFGFQN